MNNSQLLLDTYFGDNDSILVLGDFCEENNVCFQGLIRSDIEDYQHNHSHKGGDGYGYDYDYYDYGNNSGDSYGYGYGYGFSNGAGYGDGDNENYSYGDVCGDGNDITIVINNDDDYE